MELIVDFVLNNGIEIIAAGILSGVFFLAGHFKGYVKRKAEEPQKDIFDIVNAVVIELEKKNAK